MGMFHTSLTSMWLVRVDDHNFLYRTCIENQMFQVQCIATMAFMIE